MFRNLSKRIEVVTPVTAMRPKQRLWEIPEISGCSLSAGPSRLALPVATQ
jgi:hypothetical protein